ncbi:hypothetical protein H9L12_04670 [Sphingomonas rhizophila]|uniref:Uncharacterized protein n=1 Tax=Sphingomonas rhizophila TaxID=2071607 RepID=A0A7G9SDB0_9SPHN|nr:hypothetical protein [Sphingomonas rhizophila]QNN65835.1 hypothetical protein H9L12_04670 [Sphingomonas rhizophila]
MSERLYWQGSHDNFCGLYAADYIIARHKTAKAGNTNKLEDSFHRAFFALLKKAEKVGLLTANRIAARVKSGGFSSPQIARIFNSLSPNAREGLIATTFASSSFKRFAESIESKDRIKPASGCLPNCAIIKHDSGTHWLAVVGVREDGSYLCFDPNSSANVRRRERIEWDDGVFISRPGVLKV